VSNDFVSLHADQGILPHPLDLPSQRREAIQAFSVVGKINGNDVRSIVGDTSEPATLAVDADDVNPLAIACKIESAGSELDSKCGI
jgi:hypothetical protein